MWLRRSFNKLDLCAINKSTDKLFVDNRGALAVTKNLTFHQRLNNIEAHFQYIWKQFATRERFRFYVSTPDNVADIFGGIRKLYWQYAYGFSIYYLRIWVLK